MSQVALLASKRQDITEEVAELERMIVSAGHVATGLESGLGDEDAMSTERIKTELNSIWEILVAAERALLRVQAKSAEDR